VTHTCDRHIRAAVLRRQRIYISGTTLNTVTDQQNIDINFQLLGLETVIIPHDQTVNWGSC